MNSARFRTDLSAIVMKLKRAVAFLEDFAFLAAEISHLDNCT